MQRPNRTMLKKKEESDIRNGGQRNRRKWPEGVYCCPTQAGRDIPEGVRDTPGGVCPWMWKNRNGFPTSGPGRDKPAPGHRPPRWLKKLQPRMKKSCRDKGSKWSFFLLLVPVRSAKISANKINIVKKLFIYLAKYGIKISAKISAKTFIIFICN